MRPSRRPFLVILAIPAGLHARAAGAQAAGAPAAPPPATARALSPALPASGASVRVVLRSAEFAPLQQVAGEPANLNVDGTLVAIDSASVTVRTTQGTTVTYPADGVRRLFVRRCGSDATASATCERSSTRPLAYAVVGAALGAVLGNKASPGVGGLVAGAAPGALAGALVGAATTFRRGPRLDPVPNWPPAHRAAGGA